MSVTCKQCGEVPGAGKALMIATRNAEEKQP